MAWGSLNDLLVCLVSALGEITTLVEYGFILRHDISKWFSYAIVSSNVW